MKKINNLHPGWLEHINGGKNHYYILEEGDFIITLCGKTMSNTHMETHSLNSEENQCKTCLRRINKFKNGEKIKVKINGIFI